MFLKRWCSCLAESPFTILNKLFQSETLDGTTKLLECLPDCQKTIAPVVQASDSGEQELVIRDDVLAVMLHKLNILLQSMQVNPNWTWEVAISLLPWQAERILIPVEFVRNGFQYLLFELLERNGQRVFKPANSGVWWQISASELGSENVLLAFVVFKDESIAMHTCQWTSPLYICRHN